MLVNDGNSPVRRWAHLVFRAAAGVAALLAVTQPFLAGGFLQGDYSLLAAHQMAAMILATAVLVSLLATVLMWRPGRGPGRPAVLNLVALLCVGLQISLGFARVLIIHIPLGILVLALVGRIAALAWQSPLRPAPAPEPAAVEADAQSAEVAV
ncbi:hypothetical protein [Streptacidiphilus sp. EB129]|uniref:hypothetical protein n=1 Tax=Streptacidiphilus sp. EB129 TaxID=3156262 RepID=UPI003514EE50